MKNIMPQDNEIYLSSILSLSNFLRLSLLYFSKATSISVETNYLHRLNIAFKVKLFLS